MKEKRAEQRLKRTNQSKLGHIIPSTILEGESDLETTSSHQYSPSISHDEEGPEVEGASGTSTEGLEVLSRCSVVTPTSEQMDGGWGGSEGDEDDDKDDSSVSETDELEEKEDEEAWGERAGGKNCLDNKRGKKDEDFNSLSIPDPIPDSVPKSTQHHMQSGNSRSSKLVLKSKTSSRKQKQEEGEKLSKGMLKAMAHRGRNSERKSTRKKEVDWKETGAWEDEGRKEKQLTSLANEVDLFADMAPKITSSPASLLSRSSSLLMDSDNASATQSPSDGMHSGSALMNQSQQHVRTVSNLFVYINYVISVCVCV